MKTVKQIVEYIILPTLQLTTVLIFLFLLCAKLMYSMGLISYETPALTISSAILCLLLAFFYSLSNLIFRLKKISLFSRALLHFFSVLISTVLVISLTSYELKQESLVLIVLFVAFYLLIVPAALLIGGKINRQEKEEKEYKSIFDPRDKK